MSIDVPTEDYNIVTWAVIQLLTDMMQKLMPGSPRFINCLVFVTVWVAYVNSLRAGRLSLHDMTNTLNILIWYYVHGNDLMRFQVRVVSIFTLSHLICFSCTLCVFCHLFSYCSTVMCKHGYELIIHMLCSLIENSIMKHTVSFKKFAFVYTGWYCNWIYLYKGDMHLYVSFLNERQTSLCPLRC